MPCGISTPKQNLWENKFAARSPVATIRGTDKERALTQSRQVGRNNGHPRQQPDRDLCGQTDLSGKYAGTQCQQTAGEQTEAQYQQTVKTDSYLHIGADGQRLFRVRLIKVH